MKKLSLGNGKFSLVDDDDYGFLSHWKWHYSNGYAVRNYWNGKGKRGIQFLHRLILQTPEYIFTDHINGNTLDNQRINLRLCTRQENTWNSKVRKDSLSKIKGINYQPPSKNWNKPKWKARITFNGKRRVIGYFDTQKEAEKAWKEMAQKLHGEFARCS